MPTIPQPLLPDDDGRADPALAAALAAFASGAADRSRVLTALLGARLLLPVVTVPAGEAGPPEADDHGHDHDHGHGHDHDHGPGACRTGQGGAAQTALPTLVGQDGRTALPVFTGAESLRRWRADARPVQATAAQACRTALRKHAAAVVVDVAGPVPFVLEGAVLQVVAVADRPTPENLRKVAETVPGITLARLGEAAPARRRRGLLGRLRRT